MSQQIIIKRCGFFSSISGYILIIIFLLLSFSNLYPIDIDEDKYQIKIKFNEDKRTVDFNVTYPAFFNEYNNTFLNVPQEFFSSGNFIKFRKFKLMNKTANADFDYKIRRKRIIITNPKISNKTVWINIDFRLKIKTDKPFLLWSYLFIPLDFIQHINIQKKITPTIKQYELEILLPSEWSLLNPCESSKERNKNGTKFIVNINSKTPPYIFAAKNIQPLINDNKYSIFGKQYLEELFLEEDNNSLIFSKFKQINDHINRYFGFEADEKEIRILLISLVSFSLTIDNSMILSKRHINNMITNLNPDLVYDVVYNISLQRLNNLTNPQNISSDYWITEGLAHMASIDYLSRYYGLPVEYTNPNKFLRFLFGPYNSTFFRTKTIFRDYIKYKSIKSLNKDNRSKLYGYDNRARVLNNHYAIQFFLNLKKIISEKKYNDILRSILNKYENNFLTTEFLIVELNEQLIDDKYKVLKDLILKYPTVDIALKKEKNNIYILKKKSKEDIYVEVEIIYKDNKKENIILFINKRKTLLLTDLKNIKNIIIDPNGLIEEMYEFNNFLHPMVHFSILAPQTTLDKYILTASGVLCSYNNNTLFGITISGGWNMKNLSLNSISKPTLQWSIDTGYGYDRANNFMTIHNGFVNLFFETSTYPLSIWAPQFYSQFFWLTGESFTLKTGLQSFLPPVINTEHDKVFFYHSWDYSFDIKAKYYPRNTIDFNINFGYKIYFKANFFTIEGIAAANFDLDKIRLHGIEFGTHINTKFDIDFFETGFRGGILKNIRNIYGYEFERPRFSRLSLVTQTIGHYEAITYYLVYAKNLIIKELPYPVMDFGFLSYYFLFKAILGKEPFLYPRATIGFGHFIDVTMPFNPESPRGLFTGFLIKADILRTTTINFKVSFLPLLFIRGNPVIRLRNPLAIFFFEIKSYF